MIEAPERIWAEPDGDDIFIYLDVLISEDDLFEYVRIDLVRAQIEAAVKRALEAAAEHLSMFAEPGVSLDYSLDDEIKAIRDLDPAQFIEGETND